MLIDPCGPQEKMGWAGVLTGGHWADILMSIVEEGLYIGIRAPALLMVVCMA